MKIDIDKVITQLKFKLEDKHLSFGEKLAYGNCLSLITDECLKQEKNYLLPKEKDRQELL